MSTTQQEQTDPGRQPARRKDVESSAGMKMEEPQAEHLWLRKLLGEWTSEMEMTMPDAPPERSTGTESFRSLGGLWILGEGKGSMPGGGTLNSMLTLGYDPRKNRYVGTWIGSAMTQLWVYSGTVDATGKVLTLDSEGPAMTPGGGTAKYRDTMTFKTDDHRVLTSEMLGDDGKWQRFMTANYRR